MRLTANELTPYRVPGFESRPLRQKKGRHESGGFSFGEKTENLAGSLALLLSEANKESREASLFSWKSGTIPGLSAQVNKMHLK